MRLIALICLLGTALFPSQAQAFFGFFGASMEEVTAQDGRIVINVSDLPQSSARHYRYRESGLVIKFFVVRDGQGIIRVALDACEACWKAGQGYKFKDGVMVCVNCGQKFPLGRIGLASGGCNPHPFPYKMENDSVIISARELLLEAKYFPVNNR
jgi:uncharacterized membrane protein